MEDPDTGEQHLLGITSSLDKYFNAHPPGELTEFLADTAERLQDNDEYDFEVSGFVTTSPDGSRYMNLLNFDGQEVNPGEMDDPITLQLRTTTANNGHESTRYTVGSFRKLCGNRIAGHYDDASFQQSHQSELDPSLPLFAMRSILDGRDEIEAQLEEAQNRRFDTRWDALEALYDTVVPEIANMEYTDVIEVFDSEVDDPDAASLYETGQAATNILSNHADHVPDYRLNPAFDTVSEQFFESGAGVPDPTETAETVVSNRYRELTETDAEEYFDGERQILEDRLDELDVHA